MGIDVHAGVRAFCFTIPKCASVIRGGVGGGGGGWMAAGLGWRSLASPGFRQRWRGGFAASVHFQIVGELFPPTGKVFWRVRTKGAVLSFKALPAS